MLHMKTVILLAAHGSRRAEANLEVHQLAEALQEKLGRSVYACFLEQAEPSIPEGVDKALQLNPQEIWVLPYFLTQGRHLSEDIPNILKEKARAYPEVPVKILPYLGAHSKMIDFLMDVVVVGSKGI